MINSLRRVSIKREIEYCNLMTFIEHGGDMHALPQDLCAWFDKLIEAMELAIAQLSEGDVMVR